MTGEVYQVWSREALILDKDENELVMPKSEQIPKDRYRKGDNVRAVVHRVEIINGTPKIILSRAAPAFLERLFELEVPEIYDGLITIKNIVREPGERAKVAVESYDERIDPVGACVGMKGAVFTRWCANSRTRTSTSSTTPITWSYIFSGHYRRLKLAR